MRTANRILAVSLALAITAGGFVSAAEIVLAAIGRGPWVIPYEAWYDSARRNQWDQSGPRWLFIGICVAGLAVLVLEALKAAPRSFPLESGRSEAGLARRDLERALSGTAARIDGVSGAKVTVDGDTARVTVDTSRQTGDLRPPVAQAVEIRLNRTGLARPPKVVVAVNKRER